MPWLRPVEKLVAASVPSGWTSDGSGAVPLPPSLVQTLRWRAQFPLDTVVGHVLDLHCRGVTVVLTLDPAGCTVVTLIG